MEPLRNELSWGVGMFGVVASALSTGICLGLLFVGLGGLASIPLSRWLRGTIVAGTLWCLGVLIMRATTGMYWEQVGIVFGYTGGIFAPVLWWRLARQWSHERGLPLRKASRAVENLPFAWMGLLWIGMLTNPWHGQFVTPVDGARNLNGPLWWAMALSVYGFGSAAVWIGVRSVLRSAQREVRNEGSLIAAATTLIGGGHAAAAAWPSTLSFDAPTAALALSSAMMTLAVRADAQRRGYSERLEREVAMRTDELQLLQRRLVQAKRLQAGEDLAGSVAHAIHNPLAALIGYLQMAAESTDPDPESQERALALAKRIQVLVDNTLQLFRRGQLKLAPLPANELLEEFGRNVNVRLPEGIETRTRIGDDLPELSADRELLLAALEGIAQNAVDALGATGTLFVDAYVEEGMFRIAVADTGPGIPEAQRGRVLQPFVTTKGGGNGLGLAIAQAVVSGHRGRIRIDDRVGGGAEITVELPIP